MHTKHLESRVRTPRNDALSTHGDGCYSAPASRTRVSRYMNTRSLQVDLHTHACIARGGGEEQDKARGGGEEQDKARGGGEEQDKARGMQPQALAPG